ncbi:hypothetical protein FACS1894172_03780 [Spirochaetia bacterium]|nr:hypothetical protein FACS1894164_21050 [Spirochaetia bacterium]GHU30458.1 hypothetical protein FACS1894172_03780 [Spirochaetia bacterium]
MKDWLPHSRVEELAFARVWQSVLAGSAGTFGIIASEVDTFTALITTAADTLKKTQDKTLRTHVDSVACSEAFKALTEKMRYLKTNYFNNPPRTVEELSLLGLTPRNTNHTQRGKPQAQMTAEVGWVGSAVLLLKLIYTKASQSLANPHTDTVFQIRWGIHSAISPQSDPERGEMASVPAKPEELPIVLITKRKKELITFGAGDSSKTAYFSIRIDNGKGECGPWCPIFSAVIT